MTTNVKHEHEPVNERDKEAGVWITTLYYGSYGEETHLTATELEGVVFLLDYCKSRAECNTDADADHHYPMIEGDPRCPCRMIEAGDAETLLTEWEHDCYGESSAGRFEGPSFYPFDARLRAAVCGVRENGRGD